MISIINAWKNVTPPLEAEVLDFLGANASHISREKLGGLAQGAVVIARNDEGIIAVTMVQKVIARRFDCMLYQYRNAIAKGFHSEELFNSLFTSTFRVLEEAFKKEQTKTALGVLMVVENSWMRDNWKKAVWKGSGLVFAGTASGLPVRLRYFEGAVIPLHEKDTTYES